MKTKPKHNEYTIAREWARERNFTKYRLLGMHKQLKVMTGANGVLIPHERLRVVELIQELEAILRSWKAHNMSSRTLFESNKRGK